MYQIKFLKEPGYFYDLLNIFVFYFNRECYEDYNNVNKYTENIEFLDQLRYEFSEIPEELFIFFYLRNGDRCFMPQYCFYDNVKKYQTEFNFEHMQADLMDTERIVSRMIQFFFPELKDGEIEEYRGDLKKLVQLIDESEYSAYVKEKLCVFFVNYESLIRKLNYELISKETELKSYYERNYKKVVNFQNEVDFCDLCFQVFKKFGKQNQYNENSILYISPCVVSINCINFLFLPDSAICLLGVNAEKTLKFIKKREQIVDLDVFGNVVAEKNRIGILDALLVRDKMSIKEIEKTFGISNTNAYYHLNMMAKANILNTCNEGRTVFYSLNRKYFDELAKRLNKYGTGNQGKLA